LSPADAARLSHMRYTGGVTGYLEVLTNETNAFSAELGLVQARLNELLALVQLYQALVRRRLAAIARGRIPTATEMTIVSGDYERRSARRGALRVKD
jgi:hypothetical protein